MSAREPPLVGVINAGSSSLKFALYEGDSRALSGQVEGIGVRPALLARNAAGETVQAPDLTRTPPATPAEALLLLLPWLRDRIGGRAIAALGHRVVHGGPRHARPERVTPALLEELTALEPLAPLHQPHNLAPIRAALAKNPDL
ncbi:MAG: acetate kinase, partial [Acetobacteraceae bacterium]|nr:acetate kinase [Acetobacteraceae bacterium]